jgi:hypothetical protein
MTHCLLAATTAVLAFNSAFGQTRFSGPETVGQLQSAAIREASGIAVSRRSSGNLWSINDSGNAAQLYLLKADGTDLGCLTAIGVRNRDWEDLASFTLEGVPYLLIAETGDNLGIHDTCSLFVVKEPRPPAEDQKLQAGLPIAWKVNFKFEDGPRDCESVAVDVAARKILLVSKRDLIPGLYELPLLPQKNKLLIAKRKGSVTLSGNPAMVARERRAAACQWQPTALDITADGSAAIIATYCRALYYPRRNREPWAATFSRPPVQLAPHHLNGCEDAAFSSDGYEIYLTAEGRGSPIVRYRRLR